MITPQARADFYNRCAVLGGWEPVRDPFCVQSVNRAAALIQHGLTYATERPARKDLTPRQIEWCRENISSFMPKVINAPR
jgi:hypothetical protein